MCLRCICGVFVLLDALDYAKVQSALPCCATKRCFQRENCFLVQQMIVENLTFMKGMTKSEHKDYIRYSSYIEALINLMLSQIIIITPNVLNVC